VNLVLEPRACTVDPISVIYTGHVKGNIDRIYELVYRVSEKSTSDFDREKVNKFDSGIYVKNGRCPVNLVWNDNIKEVHNNYHIAKAVLGKVVDRLTSGVYESYDAVFQQQLEEGILERVPLHCEENRIFLPHRGVIKTDQTVSTKVRPVINCSVKVSGNPSLNEAAYPGVNIMGTLFNLLIGSRCDNFLVLSDIRKAFLQIKLARDEDRNKFCILWRTENGLKVYRYTTIVFGFIASPFILNYVVKNPVKR
jgi:hypothetical protein